MYEGAIRPIPVQVTACRLVWLGRRGVCFGTHATAASSWTVHRRRGSGRCSTLLPADHQARSMTDHPRAPARERLVPVGGRHSGAAPCSAGATSAPGRVLEPCVCSRALRLMASTLVGFKGDSLARGQQGQPRCADPHPRRGPAAVGAGHRVVAGGQAAKRVEATAVRACVVVGWHYRGSHEVR